MQDFRLERRTSGAHAFTKEFDARNEYSESNKNAIFFEDLLELTFQDNQHNRTENGGKALA